MIGEYIHFTGPDGLKVISDFPVIWNQGTWLILSFRSLINTLEFMVLELLP